MADTPYTEITEVEATLRGLPEQADTTYRRDSDGIDRGYNVGAQVYWPLGRSLFGADLDIGGLPRDKGPIADAIAKAQATLVEALEAHGGKPLCSVMIVHAEGFTPDGGIDAYADDHDGPQTPDDLLAFALRGVGALAKRYGLPFAVMDVAGEGGQG
jgi:hypothetical protein